jgi:hypothetical protein
MKPRSLKISKLDAAKRQLETVVRLYFSNGDPVSIHTLTAAAYNVIRDLNAKRGGKPLFMKEESLHRIKEGHQQEFRRILNQAENFFKHADRDHEETLDFNPDQSEFLILEACSVYHRMSGEFPPLFKLYQTWFVANHPNMFNFTEEQQRAISMGRKEVINLGREGYFNVVLPIMFRTST